MHKKWNGYLTVEASFVMPIVLFLYLLIILCGFFLYNRCVISQDNYLLAFRGSRFTNAGENYGEVIYGNMDGNSPDRQYIGKRLTYKSGYYPFFHLESEETDVTDSDVTITVIGYQGALKIKKKAERLNIVEIIEKARR